MLASVAISETAKAMAFELINHGYSQCRQGVMCPICGEKYIVLLDSKAYQRHSDTTQPVQTMAVNFFAERLRQAHTAGHYEKKLIMV
ncbi:MAG TPA: hypothetical protein VI685_10480 [Candidatus Angelobacter sp.]